MYSISKIIFVNLHCCRLEIGRIAFFCIVFPTIGIAHSIIAIAVDVVVIIVVLWILVFVVVVVVGINQCHLFYN